MRITVPFPRTRGRSDAQPPLNQRWLLLPVVLVVITGLVFWQLQVRSAPVAPTTAAISQGNLTITVSGSGTVAAARSVDLGFQQSGTVTAVDVKVGDLVKTGQTLAQIDAADLQLELQQAQANLKSAEAKLAQARNGSPTPQDLASAQASLDSAKAQLEKTRTGDATRSDIQSAQAQLDAAQAKLDALKNPSPANLSAAQIQLAQAQTSLQTTRDSDSQAKASAYNQMQQAVDSLTQAQSKYATAQKNWAYVQETGRDPAQPSNTSANGKKVANKLSDTQRQQYYDAFVQAQAALHSAEQSVQQAQVNYDTARQKEAVDVPLAEQQVANAQTQLDALLHPSANDIKQAQATVVQAQANLTKLRQGGTPADIIASQAQVTQAQANVDKLTAPASAPDIAAAEAGVIQAQAALATAQRNLDQATLKATFDGVVATVGIQLGATSGSGGSSSSSSTTSAPGITLVDRSKLHIDVNLSETDAAKVQVGQPVALTFDALPNVAIIGRVATVAPAATVQQNVVTYPVQVEFDPGTTPVKVGMSATADIQIQQINDAILAPSRAVQTTGNAKVITVLQGPQQIPVPVQVETGATSNGEVAILSCVATGAQCLRPGDVLALPSATTGATQQGANRGGLGGGFGPRPGGIPFGR
jgi:HlyD family secretion protein